MAPRKTSPGRRKRRETERRRPHDHLVRVIVKFRGQFELAYEDHAEIRARMAEAAALDRTYEPVNLLTYFRIDCPPGTDAEALVQALQKLRTVEFAYVDVPGPDPIVTPDDDPRSVNQGYLDPAPDGIDAEFAWPRTDGTGFPGGDGAGIRFIDRRGSRPHHMAAGTDSAGSESQGGLCRQKTVDISSDNEGTSM